jgi:hypothetical protein
MPTASKEEIGAKIVKMRDQQNKNWSEVSEAVGLAPGKCMYLYDVATVTPATKIKGKTEEDLKKNVAKARNAGLSWGTISARAGKSEGWCRAAFEEVTGELARGNRIGKGGRHPEDSDPAKAAKKAKVQKPAKKTAKAVKKAAKAAPVKKAAKKATAKKATRKAVKAVSEEAA